MNNTTAIGISTWSDGTGVPHVRDFRLDSSGQIEMSVGIDAYRQIVECVIRTLLGEILLDAGRGIDYENTVFVSGRRLNRWNALVRRAVGDLYFVKSVDSLESRITKEGSVKFVLKATTDIGELELEREVAAA